MPAQSKGTNEGYLVAIERGRGFEALLVALGLHEVMGSWNITWLAYVRSILVDMAALAAEDPLYPTWRSRVSTSGF